MSNKDVEFGFIITAVGGEGESDAQMYKGMMSDVEKGIELGFNSAWMIEHHFTDYFPTPNPLQLLSHIAGRYPDIDLGTAVLVLPWYNPLRLAEDISLLRMVTDRKLHIGIGRGTAILEYERFGIPNMDETRDRFHEIIDIVREATSNDTFTYDGKFYNVGLETTLRPKVDNWDNTYFYGAVGGSPESSHIMADEGLPIACTAWGNIGAQEVAVASWRERIANNGVNPDDFSLPVMLNCIVADSDDEAIDMAKQYIPIFMQAQLDHYDTHRERFEQLESYKAWGNVIKGWEARTNPDNIPAWCEGQLVGSPETCIKRAQEFVDIGFGQIIIHCSTPGVPAGPRQEWMTRFANDVMPNIKSKVAAAA